MERLRLGLVGAKTPSQMQSAVNELLARHGVVRELLDQEAVRHVRQFVFGDDWQRVRNLALFALASYQRPPRVEPIPGDTEGEPETTPETAKVAE
jgi:CRISPR-associated protein Cas8a1/Csx13